MNLETSQKTQKNPEFKPRFFELSTRFSPSHRLLVITGLYYNHFIFIFFPREPQMNLELKWPMIELADYSNNRLTALTKNRTGLMKKPTAPMPPPQNQNTILYLYSLLLLLLIPVHLLSIILNPCFFFLNQSM